MRYLRYNVSWSAQERSVKIGDYEILVTIAFHIDAVGRVDLTGKKMSIWHSNTIY